MRWWKCPSTALKLAKLSPRRSRQWSCVRTLIAGFRAGRMRSQCCWQFQWHPFPICEPVSKNFEPVSLGAAQKNGKSPRAPEIRRATGLLRRWIDGASRHRNKDKSLIMRLLSAPDVETVSSADWVVVEAVTCEPVSALISLPTGKITGKLTQKAARAAFWLLKAAQRQRVSREFPARAEQGFEKCGTASLIAGTGNVADKSSERRQC
jgi:hypothetical protein